MRHEDYVSDIGVDALLFQTGYLTIVGEEHRGPRTLYRLDYPNFEVQQSLNQGLLEYVTCRDREAVDHGEALVRLLGEHDFDGFAERFRSFLAGVPYPWHDSGNLDRYESWYTSMLYMSFRTIGVDLRVEETSHRGGSDLVVLHQGQVFVQEGKMAQDARETEAMRDRAVEQMG